MTWQITGASWLLLALGAGYCMAEVRSLANPTNNLLEIRSLTVDGKPVDLRGEGERRISPFPEAVTFEFGARGSSNRAPIRLRYKLEGHEPGWHEGACEMFVAMRFFDESGDQIGQKLFYARGDSSGWNGDLKTSTLTHRRETFTVPPKASRLWVVISSAGPPATVGIFVVDDLVVRRPSSRNGLPEVVIEPPFDRQSSSLLTNQAPQGWMRDGYRPSMAKIVEVGIGVRAKALAIWDDDPLGHAEWHTIKESAPQVVPGEQLDVEWNELFSMGVGNVQDATYGRLAGGNYRFRVVEVTPLGQPTGEEASLLIRVPPPFWDWPWFWAMVVTVLVAGSVLSGRYYTWRRMRQEMLRLKHQRMVEHERLRIAQDIHDDLGARVTQISLASAMAQENPAFPEGARTAFDNISRMSRELVSALYQTVWAVNPENDNLDALGNYLCQMANQLCTQAGLRCRLDVVDLPQNIQVSSQTRHNITMAVKEAIHNVIKHAKATAVNLRTVFREGVLLVSVQDDGCGFQLTGEPSGSGLNNIKRRLADIGGTCSIESQVGKGTTIEMRLQICSPDS